MSKEREETAKEVCKIIEKNYKFINQNTATTCKAIADLIIQEKKQARKEVAREYHYACYACIGEGETATPGFHKFTKRHDEVSEKYLPEMFNSSTENLTK